MLDVFNILVLSLINFFPSNFKTNGLSLESEDPKIKSKSSSLSKSPNFKTGFEIGLTE